jgi:4-amino-4-deoxy-L-arabinose transferase-like glycosyltransferase
MQKTASFPKLLLVIAGALLFIPFLGASHLFDWDEINFAECAREMIASNNYTTVQINFLPFWEKPPLFIWMQVIAMKIFGINEFAARFPNAICGIVTLLTLFNIGKREISEKFGIIWSLVYTGSILPHLYFKSGIIDPWFNLFIFLSIYHFMRFQLAQHSYKRILLSASFLGLAVLTKGPVAIIITGLCIGTYYLLTGFKKFPSIKSILLFILIFIGIGSLWFILLVLNGKGAIITEFIQYQIRLFSTEDAGHGGPFVYHFIVLLIGCFPASVFAIRAMQKNTDATSATTHLVFRKWMLILFWVVLILFSIVKTKIVHYSSLCYFPLTFLAAYSAELLIKQQLKWQRWMTYLLLVMGIILGIAFTGIQFVDTYKSELISSNLIKDDFAVENLKAAVSWSGYEFLLGVFFIAGIITGLVYITRLNKPGTGITILFVTTFIITNLIITVITPKVEQYSQAAALEFYEKTQTEKCYVTTLGFKSYAYLFYSKTQEEQNRDTLLIGKISKPAYFVSKINYVETVNNDYPFLTEVGRKNGFVFWVRRP